MKKIILSGIVALSLSLAMPIVAWAEEKNSTAVTIDIFMDKLNYIADTQTKYAVTSDVNIRLEPNLESEIIGHTKLNESFEILLELGDWSMICFEEQFAFIKSEYLSEMEVSLEYVGDFKISHYCCEKYKHICGTGSGKTATGLDVRPGLISVDPSVIPLGSTVVIDGKEYQAEDTGGMIKGKKIDMAVLGHQEALDLGVYYAEVYIKKGKQQ